MIAPNRAAGDCQRAHAVFTHVAEGHHFTASLKKSLNMLTTRKMITSNNMMPAVIARMRKHFSRMLPAINPACTLRLLIFWWLRLVLAVSRCENALRRFYVRREEFLPPTAVARPGETKFSDLILTPHFDVFDLLLVLCVFEACRCLRHLALGGCTRASPCCPLGAQGNPSRCIPVRLRDGLKKKRPPPGCLKTATLQCRDRPGAESLPNSCSRGGNRASV